MSKQSTTIPAVQHNGKKTFTVLENNPTVMNPLAHAFGLPPSLAFHDLYTLSAADHPHIPRPIHALLVILPLTPTWRASRDAEDAAQLTYYQGVGPAEPVLWFKQTIGHACGSIGLLHCLLNLPAVTLPFPRDSFVELVRAAVTGLQMEERARWLYDCQEFEDMHAAVAGLGDTVPPDADGGDRLGQHFVAFVGGSDGGLWELEGSRKGPIRRGELREGEDMLSERVIELGLGRIIKMEVESGGGDLRFSAIALAAKGDDDAEG